MRRFPSRIEALHALVTSANSVKLAKLLHVTSLNCLFEFLTHSAPQPPKAVADVWIGFRLPESLGTSTSESDYPPDSGRPVEWEYPCRNTTGCIPSVPGRKS
jgi:hypothetical protein